MIFERLFDWSNRHTRRASSFMCAPDAHIWIIDYSCVAHKCRRRRTTTTTPYTYPTSRRTTIFSEYYWLLSMEEYSRVDDSPVYYSRVQVHQTHKCCSGSFMELGRCTTGLLFSTPSSARTLYTVVFYITLLWVAGNIILWWITMAVLRMVGSIDVFSSFFSVGTCITVLIPIGITGDTFWHSKTRRIVKNNCRNC